MNIQGIQKYQTYNMKVKLAKKKPAYKDIVSEKRVEDSYEPSNTIDRKKLLSIRQKKKDGYYNSEEVVEDLSESFAQIFDQKL